LLRVFTRAQTGVLIARLGLKSSAACANVVREREIGLEPTAFDSPLDVFEPEAVQAPILFSSPHSGNVFADEFLRLTRLSLPDLRRSADLYVDELLAGAVARGIPLIKALFPRCYVDVNREPYELDPRMFAGRLPVFANSKTARVASGYGTLARLAGDNQEIYRQRLPVEEAFRRIDRYYLPYHAALQQHMQRLYRQFGQAVLIDWHSMPSAVFPSHRSLDVVLGDRHGSSCSPQLVDFAEHVLRGLGFTVQRNVPYAGGYITERYGNPARGMHALQIELNRALYMNEEAQMPHQGFGATAEALVQFSEALIAFDDWQVARIAAE
jgi:N-formylglutamate deformylase